MRNLGSQSLSPIMDAPRMGAIVDAHFPTHPVNVHELRPVAADSPKGTERLRKMVSSVLSDLYQGMSSAIP